MRYLFIIFFLVTTTLSCSGQFFTFPKIIKKAKEIKDFAPKGWTVFDTVKGDLNKDKIDDAALILECSCMVKEARTNKLGNEGDSPRILLILFKVGNHYELKLQHNTFILRSGEREYDDSQDPYKPMVIYKGALNINFEILYQHSLQNLNYVVRYQGGDFYLIGATIEESADSGTTKSDYNFSTRKYIYDELDNSDGKTKEIIKTIPLKMLKKLIELNEPYTWEFNGEFI